MNLNRFLDEYFRSHPAMREAYEAGREAGRKAAETFPNGRCPMCQRPLDDHTQGRCPK